MFRPYVVIFRYYLESNVKVIVQISNTCIQILLYLFTGICSPCVIYVLAGPLCLLVEYLLVECSQLKYQNVVSYLYV
jgi:hypothetical protein